MRDSVQNVEKKYLSSDWSKQLPIFTTIYLTDIIEVF